MTEQQEKVESTAVAPKKTRRASRMLMWVLGPALVLGAGGWLYLTSGRYASTDNAYVQADRVTIAPQVGGRVVEVAVRENETVHKGDVLFRIDAEPLQIAEVLKPLGVEYDAAAIGNGGSDLSAVHAVGMAAVSLHQDATRYFDWHHTANDTLDKIDPEQLRQNVAVYAVTAYLAAQANGDFGSKPGAWADEHE